MYKSVLTLLTLSISVLIFLSVPARAQAAETRISIPSISVDALIVNAPLSNELQTWDVSHLAMNVGHLEYMGWFGENGNIVLAGHSVAANGSADIFYHLDKVKIGDEITVEDAGVTYRYVVTLIRNVDRTDISILASGDVETITLFTCDVSSYSGDGTYNRRDVVVAQRVS
jgi:LPXTG-site transpeptidase (sortase) family protein